MTEPSCLIRALPSPLCSPLLHPQALPLDHALRPVTWPEYRALSCKLASVAASEAPNAVGGSLNGGDGLREEGRLGEEAIGSLFQLCRERRAISTESNWPQAPEDSGQVLSQGAGVSCIDSWGWGGEGGDTL